MSFILSASIGKKVFSAFVDALLSHPGMQMIADSVIGDNLWYPTSLVYPLYFVEDSNSKSAFRQGASAITRSYRFVHSGIKGDISHIVATLLSKVPSLHSLPKKSSIKENKRLLLAQTRNSHIYKDLADFFISCLYENEHIGFLLKNGDLSKDDLIAQSSFSFFIDSIEKNEVQPLFSYNKIRKMFTNETKLPFDEVFRAVCETPNQLGSGRVAFDAILNTGEDVSIQMFNPIFIVCENMMLLFSI